MIRYVIRNAHSGDLAGLQRLAKMLNTVNLPDETSALLDVLKRSAASFSGQIKNPTEREYVFVVDDLTSHQIIGSSQVIAQHGTRDAPHIFFEVGVAERYSKTIDRHFKHQVLRLGFNYEGPTEIGGLIVDPEYRHVPEKLGRQLSLVRFLFVAMNRSLFGDRILAELLPPLMPNGQSLLWEALGRRFTGLDYTEADHISRTNKEFIQGLFPEGQIYTCLFSEEVQKIIGEVGPESLPAKHLLEAIGFRYQDRVDPFDGGPHFEGVCDDIAPIKDSVCATLSRQPETRQNTSQWLIASLQNGFSDKVQFRSALIPAAYDKGTQMLMCSDEDLVTLGLENGSRVRAYEMKA